MATTILSPAPVLRTYDNSGNLAIGGQIYTYAAGTSTPQATYTDSTGSTPNTNPVILNSRGEASIWINPSQSYKFVAYDASNNLLWSQDNISYLSSPGSTFLTQNGIYGKNRLLNAEFFLAQRATSAALTNGVLYSVFDNWFALQSSVANGTISQVNGVIAGVHYSAKVGRNNGAVTLNSIILGQTLSTNESIPMAGQTVILSFYARAGTTYSSAANILNATLYTGTGTNQSSTNMLNGVWTGPASTVNSVVLTPSSTRYFFVYSIPTTVTQMGIAFSYAPVGAAGSDDNFYISDVQLEIALNNAVSPTTFERLTTAETVLRSARGFTVLTFDAIGAGVAGSAFGTSTALHTPMQIAPTLTQLANNVHFAQSNCTATTSTYLSTTQSVTAFRSATATAATQFSETTACSAEL